MDAPDLLRQLHEAGFTIAPAGGDGIRVAPSASLTDAHRQAIRSHRAELLALLAPSTVVEPDRWRWPYSDGMSGTELEQFAKRVAQFTWRGVSADAADLLADRLAARDRDNDDRRMCIECTHLSDRGRCHAAVAGRIRGADRQLEPHQSILQRCEAFGLRKGLA